MRTGQHIAQIMADFADCQPQGLKMAFLLQHLGKIILHSGQFNFGNTNFIATR